MECQLPLDAEKASGRSLLRTPTRNLPSQDLDFSPVKLISDF